MPHFKPGYGPDGTPKQPKKPSVPAKKYGPDGYPVHHETSSRQWIPEKRGKDRDGFEWVIPGHWSDDPGYQPKPEKEPVVYMQHKCHIDGAFILVGGYIKIIDGNVEKGKRGHELFLRFGGIGIGGMDGSGKVGITGGYSEGNIDSDYASVTDQSGIYAGDEGFDIYVEDNTDLKGGIISGDNTEDNKLSTGTLTYEDVKNEAEYEAGSTGVNVNIDNGADYNEKGVTPNIGMPAEDEAESTTKATISEGEIEIRDKENQKQDLAGLNRDTQNSLNKLGEIFDKDSIEERQELAGLFGELAYNQIHDMDGTKEQKAAYHALVGGIMSELVGGDFAEGAAAAGINKMVSDKIYEVAKGDPALTQWLSAAVGASVGSFWNNMQVAASITVNGTKNNYLRDDIAPQKIEFIVWPLKTKDGDIQLAHVGMRIIYNENESAEVHYGNYASIMPFTFGKGTILQLKNTNYSDVELQNNKAYILDAITNETDTKMIVQNINKYMYNSKKIGADKLREDVLEERGEYNFDSAYSSYGEFYFYELFANNCLDFAQTVSNGVSEKLNRFSNVDFRMSELH